MLIEIFMVPFRGPYERFKAFNREISICLFYLSLLHILYSFGWIVTAFVYIIRFGFKLHDLVFFSTWIMGVSSGILGIRAALKKDVWMSLISGIVYFL